MDTASDGPKGADGTGPSICFLFRAGRRERLARPGEAPTEFFYGFAQLSRRGWPIVMLDEGEVARLAGAPTPQSIAPGSPLARLRALILGLLPGLPLVILSHFLTGGVRRAFARFEAIVATTTGQAYALAVLRRLGLYRGRAIVLAMGIWSPDQPGLQRRVFAWLLRGVEILCIARDEVGLLRSALGPATRIAYLPFGVDTGFWTPGAPGPAEPESPAVLAIGNDRHRDFATLVAAWRPTFPRLLIVTALEVDPKGKPNIAVRRGDWRSAILSDEEVRGLFRAVRLVVIPLNETIQPSGQSTCLQAMACGCPVVISDIAGIWDRTLIVDGETCRLVPPGDAAALSETVGTLLAADDDRARLAAAGHAMVRTHLTVDVMADAIERHLREPAAC